MEVLILGVNTMYMLFCFFKLFPMGCIGLNFDRTCQLVRVILGQLKF